MGGFGAAVMQANPNHVLTILLSIVSAASFVAPGHFHTFVAGLIHDGVDVGAALYGGCARHWGLVKARPLSEVL